MNCQGRHLLSPKDRWEKLQGRKIIRQQRMYGRSEYCGNQSLSLLYLVNIEYKIKIKVQTHSYQITSQINEDQFHFHNFQINDEGRTVLFSKEKLRVDKESLVCKRMQVLKCAEYFFVVVRRKTLVMIRKRHKIPAEILQHLHLI